MGAIQDRLAEIKEKTHRSKSSRMKGVKARLIVGTATCGVSAGARDVVNAFNQEIEARGLKGAIVTETGCSGRCDLEPLVQVVKEGEAPTLYYLVTPEKSRRIIQQHIVNNDVVEEWTLL